MVLRHVRAQQKQKSQRIKSFGRLVLFCSSVNVICVSVPVVGPRIYSMQTKIT